jgi:hypothetical protein
MLGKIDHDALPRARRQDASAWECQVFIGPRNPHIDSGIRADDLVVAETVALGEIRKRVLVDGRDARVLANDGRAVSREWENPSIRRSASQKKPSATD